jgi:hypothetical protein
MTMFDDDGCVVKMRILFVWSLNAVRDRGEEKIDL